MDRFQQGEFTFYSDRIVGDRPIAEAGLVFLLLNEKFIKSLGPDVTWLGRLGNQCHFCCRFIWRERGMRRNLQLTVKDFAFFERSVVLRMPFRFGVVTLREAPQCQDRRILAAGRIWQKDRRAAKQGIPSISSSRSLRAAGARARE